MNKTRAFYEHIPGAPIHQQEFGFYCLDRWKQEGHINDETDLNELFGYEAFQKTTLHGLGWCEAAFEPAFEVKIIEDRGQYEVEQDVAGRYVLYFKGRRSGFMPEYLDHPVKDFATWEQNVKWRLDPKSPMRYQETDATLAHAKQQAEKGDFICQNVIGGYMYLRSLMGPEALLYQFYDEPDLIHDCMRTWFELADTVIARHQQAVTIDELFLAEDICYNNGPLISPDMIREFLFPYYQQLISNLKRRQLDPSRHLYLQIDTDGDCRPVIPLYQSLGMDYMSPFEAASGCDVVALRKQYPDLLMRGGFDKRILAAGRDAIDREIDRIMPFMKAQGGYIPTCDHGVPEEVRFEDYLHFRKRMLEFA